MSGHEIEMNYHMKIENKGISGSDLQKYSSQEKIKTGSFCMRIIYKELKYRKWRKWPKNIQKLTQQRNYVFGHNSNFLIPISLQSDGVNL